MREDLELDSQCRTIERPELVYMHPHHTTGLERRVRQHLQEVVATLPRATGVGTSYKKFGDEPSDHAIGRSLATRLPRNHLVCDGNGRVLAFMLTAARE